MPKASQYENKQIGIWKVIKKANKRDKIGRIIYLCLNTRTNKLSFKTSNFLAQVQKYKCKTDKRGRPRKWIIKKVPIKKWKIVKTPIVE